MLLVRGALCGQKNELAAWRWKAPRRWHFHHDQEGSFDLTGTQMRRLDHVLHVLRQSWCRWHYNKWSLEKRRDATALPYHSDHLHWIRSKAADSKDYLQVLTGAFVSPACFRRARRSCIVLSVLTRLWSQIKITFFGIVQQMLYMPQDYSFWRDHHFLWMNCNLSNVGWHGLWAHFWLPSTIRFWLGSSRCGESCWLIGGDDDDAADVCRPSVGCMRSYKHAVLEVWWWWISGSMGCLPLPWVVSTGIATGRTMGFLGRLWLDRIPVMSLKWWL